MADLNDFIQAEKNRSWWNKILDIPPVITETKTIAQFAKKKIPGYQTAVHPSISRKIAATLVIGFLLLIFVLFIKSAFTEQVSWGVTVVVSCLLPAIIYATINDTFFDKETLFTILIDNTGIACGNAVYEWADVIETYVISKSNGKSTNHFLLLHTKTGGFEKFDLHKFNIGIGRLSFLIEYYKSNANLNAITPHTI